MANTYTTGTHTFALDTATNVAGLATLKGSACAYTDHITGGDHLTVESDVACASIDAMPTITTGVLTINPVGLVALATSADLTTYGYTAGATMLLRASERVRGYLAGRLSAAGVFTDPPVVPASLTELVCAIAARMAASDPSVVQGVRSEGSGAENVTYGAEAYAGTVDLNGTERKRLDRLFPSAIRTVEL